MRIISTVPSITELLYDLGLENEVVGITKFCVHPNLWYKSKQRIGGTKTLSIQKIISLNPDLIIANKEENVKDQINHLSAHAEIKLTDIRIVEDNLSLIADIATLTNRVNKGEELIEKYNQSFAKIKKSATSKSAVYLIWQDPYMTAGGDTYINSMMNLCGLHNLMKHQLRYPTVDMSQLKELKPEMLLLSSEPYPFKEKHLAHFQSELPNTKVVLVDGEVFSWYGTRLIKKSEYLINFINGL